MNTITQSIQKAMFRGYFEDVEFCLHYTCITYTCKQHYRIEKKHSQAKAKGPQVFVTILWQEKLTLVLI